MEIKHRMRSNYPYSCEFHRQTNIMCYQIRCGAGFNNLIFKGHMVRLMLKENKLKKVINDS